MKSQTLNTHVLQRDATLLDGSRVTLRSIRPSDSIHLQDLFARVSPRSRYLRFHHYVAGLTEEESERYTAANNGSPVGIVATLGAASDERIVGVGHYFRVAPAAAEVAILVDDEYQGRGIATLILDALAEAGSASGIDTFEAYVLGENRSMMEVLHGAGFPLKTTLKYGEMHVTFPISERLRIVRAAA